MHCSVLSNTWSTFISSNMSRSVKIAHCLKYSTQRNSKQQLAFEQYNYWTMQTHQCTRINYYNGAGRLCLRVASAQIHWSIKPALFRQISGCHLLWISIRARDNSLILMLKCYLNNNNDTYIPIKKTKVKLFYFIVIQNNCVRLHSLAVKCIVIHCRLESMPKVTTRD